MDRKMRALRNNAEARARRDQPSRPVRGVIMATGKSGLETGRALILPPGDDPFISPVLLNHDEKTFEVLPEREDMN